MRIMPLTPLPIPRPPLSHQARLLGAGLLDGALAEDLFDGDVDVANVLLHQVMVLLVLLRRLRCVALLVEKLYF